MTGIYKITSPTDKIYIGQSRDINNRFNLYKQKKCKGQRKLYNSLKKHGYNNHKFQILQEFPDNSIQFVLDFFESYYYNREICNDSIMLNLKVPGFDGNSGKHSQETKNLISKIKTKQRDFSQFTRDGLFVKHWDRLKEAAKELKIPEKSIRLNLIGKTKICKNYRFRNGNDQTDLLPISKRDYTSRKSRGKKPEHLKKPIKRYYTLKENRPPTDINTGRQKTVKQYYLDGTFIKKWKSIDAVVRNCGVSHCKLEKLLKDGFTGTKHRKLYSLGGYKWSY